MGLENSSAKEGRIAIANKSQGPQVYGMTLASTNLNFSSTLHPILK